MLWLYLVLCVTSALGKNIHSSGVAPIVKLNDGYAMPRLGLGTWLGILTTGSPEEVQQAVEAAIDAGYRHIDTAHIYNTEKQVGKGLKKKIEEGVVKREDMFITTKLWSDAHPRDAVIPTLNESLNHLGMDYVDLYLIHWPVATFFELGVVPIPKSVKKNRVEENIDIFDFELTPEERNLLKSYDANYRTIDPKFWKKSPYYPFNN
ncbi:aldo-keto reductase [Danaus plexippus plexippus]|uniref:Aldo-keto reductase n=1 Tax=Danaus plexippus plexippus TaxID=278856 RepID=A0A212ET88_DANPL|nr:aldo-keto reductase AKR2E4-like [Danaus plexippus plexippus]OWR44661.1 aldo-keto reductase [Danaus plexippus plexippus]